MKEMNVYNSKAWRHKTLISTATEGLIRFEWAQHRYGQVIPVNWECSGFDLNLTICGFWIDDAYNLVVKHALENQMEWLIIIEDDVLIPLDCFLKFSKYIQEKSEAVVSALYYTKGDPCEPLLFRGRGNGSFNDWKLGDKVRVDGLPMGCLLIHVPVLCEMWDISEDYKLPDGTITRRVFETPKKVWVDPETGAYRRNEGTQDLYFFDRMIENNILEKAGWKDLAKEEFPFLCDTSMLCKHIDRNTGVQFPN